MELILMFLKRIYQTDNNFKAMRYCHRVFIVIAVVISICTSSCKKEKVSFIDGLVGTYTAHDTVDYPLCGSIVKQYDFDVYKISDQTILLTVDSFCNGNTIASVVDDKITVITCSNFHPNVSESNNMLFLGYIASTSVLCISYNGRIKAVKK